MLAPCSRRPGWQLPCCAAFRLRVMQTHSRPPASGPARKRISRKRARNRNLFLVAGRIFKGMHDWPRSSRTVRSSSSAPARAVAGSSLAKSQAVLTPPSIAQCGAYSPNVAYRCCLQKPHAARRRTSRQSCKLEPGSQGSYLVCARRISQHGSPVSQGSWYLLVLYAWITPPIAECAPRILCALLTKSPRMPSRPINDSSME